MELEITEMIKDNDNEPKIVILNDISDFSKNGYSNNNNNSNNSNNSNSSKKGIHDLLLSKMGMNVENGKLSLNKQEKYVPTMQCSKIKCSKLQQSIKEQNQSQGQTSNPNQNSYIYNKYFKNQGQYQNEFEQERVPLTKEQLIQKLISDKIQRQRIRAMKSTKLIMPNDNIHFAPDQNFNRLFGFSKR